MSNQECASDIVNISKSMTTVLSSLFASSCIYIFDVFIVFEDNNELTL